MFPSKKWGLFTFLGWLLGIVLILLLSGFLDSIGIEGLQFYVGLGVSAGVGIMQWLVLRNAMPMTFKWVWYSILGVATPFLLFDLITKYGDFSLKQFYIPVCVLLGGIAISVLQSKLLKPYVNNAQRWIWLSFSAWAVSALAVIAIEYTKYVSGSNLVLFFLNLALILSGGIILGSFTASFLRKNIKAS